MRTAAVLTLASLLLVAGAARGAPPAWLPDAANCIEQLSAFNEERAWAHLALDDTSAVVLVQSAREDGVYVELGCSYRGDTFEGERRVLPAAMQGATLERSRYDAAHLAEIVTAAERALGTTSDVESIDLAAISTPRARALATVTFAGSRAAVLDEALALADMEPPQRADFAVAPPPPPSGTRFARESFMQDPVAFLAYLEGALGRSTELQRLVFQQQMVLIATRAGDDTHSVNYTLHGGELNPGDPMVNEPSAGSKCSKHSTVAAAKASLERALVKRGARIRQGMMLLLECEAAGGVQRWQLIGGDGKVEEGKALATEEFAF